ncbi:hypothetical protein ANN_21557 [Periplaneta americana]|uniref:Uncharacterized protein n=1 Tax=Periplaneta americana TaxID=6978 RepID=A0ABQ8S661_PERAM|nr:hypothetical protein ANN_21557 [Periplaneta americana]
MAGLCEGGNEPPGSLKTTRQFVVLLGHNKQMKGDERVPLSPPHGALRRRGPRRAGEAEGSLNPADSGVCKVCPLCSAGAVVFRLWCCGKQKSV